MKCKNCGKELLDTRQKFCSIDCQDDYIENLEYTIQKLLKDDALQTLKQGKF